MFLFFDIFYRDTVNKHHYLRIAQTVAAGINIIPGVFKGAGFQTFVIQDKSASGPMQHFYFVTGFVDKDIHIPANGRLAKLVLNQPAKAVKTFAHIGGLAVEVKL